MPKKKITKPRSDQPAKAEPRNVGGRPEFVPTELQRKTVKMAAGFMISHEEIALGLGIGVKTLDKHFRLELDNGRAWVKFLIAKALITNADKDAATRIFLGKTVLGLKETSRQEITGVAGGPPIKVESLTDDQLDIVISRIQKGLTGQPAG